jgi:hypothetical protein
MQEASRTVVLTRVGEILVAAPVTANPGDPITWRAPQLEKPILLFPEPWIFVENQARVEFQGETTLTLRPDVPRGIYPYSIYRRNWRERELVTEFEVSEHSAFAIGGSHPRIRIT